MSVDLRTRKDGDETRVDPHAFFSSDLPAALERNREGIAPGAALLRLRPLTIETDAEVWSLVHERGRTVVITNIDEFIASNGNCFGARVIFIDGIDHTICKHDIGRCTNRCHIVARITGLLG